MTELVAHHRDEVAEIEMRMLAEPALIPTLRQDRIEALDRLRAAEAAARPSKHELWEQWASRGRS